MNGYFQLELKDRGVYLKLIPPQEGGAMCTVEDITAYLEYHNITGYNLVEIKRLLDRRAAATLFLSGIKLPLSSEEVFIRISEDKMQAVAKFYAPFTGGVLLDRSGIESALALHGITTGIKEDVIAQFLEAREYCTDYVIAEGIQPEQGKDAEIEYFFDTELRAKPQLNEDGSVDFHKLNSISHITKGTVLAALHPEIKGKPGANVLGQPIPPREVKKKKLEFGKNIRYTEDRLSIVSEVDGHVSLVDGKVFVSDTYEVAGDVDAGTGDIEYNGNIEVKGNVLSGFSLKAKGNIIVNGVVEGADLSADGDIVLKRGVQGMSKGCLEAKGNIVSRFIENATVYAGGNVTAEAILHSHVSAGDSILVTGHKGFITGGKVCAGVCIEAKTIGSTMGAETTISVGIDPKERERLQEIQKELVALQKEQARLEPLVRKITQTLGAGVKLPADKAQQMKTIVVQYQNNKSLYEQREDESFELMEKEEFVKDARIRVSGKIYPGVKIMISDSMLVIKDIAQYCQFRQDGVDVKMSGL